MRYGLSYAMRTGITELPLHYGRAPRWLFERMMKLSRAIIEAMIVDQGAYEFLRRVSDPFWFQAFGAVLGFDWHSSGVTTTVCGAMKEGTRDISNDLGIYFCGGKGRASRKTPMQIQKISAKLSINPIKLIYASKTSAKVDNACVQDGYNLYHHMFIFTKNGEWSVIQQGMNPKNRLARRYHWVSLNLNSYVNEPHTAVCCDQKRDSLNMVADESEPARNIMTEISKEHPDKIMRETKRILKMPNRHPVLRIDINPKYFHKILLKTYERAPGDFENLINIDGVGPKTIRAVALISELLYGRRYYNPLDYKPFAFLQVDVKEVVDGDTLPIDTYGHLKEQAKQGIPLYQFTAIDIRTRLRFLAYGQQDSFNNGWAFIILVVLWIRAFDIKHHITIQTDWGEEFGGTSGKKIAWMNHLLSNLKAEITRIHKGRAQQNGYVERSHRTDDEELYIPYGLEIKDTNTLFLLTYS